ncbi:MAG TPA: DUF4129 domain-containing protein [Steroidobacteraceae bacterium]|nr:DUF4129 domain-containing protein [Steroidobacteraceae bacterium]
MKRGWTALLCVVVASPFAHADGARGDNPRAALESCIRRLDSRVDVGYDRISARCPELTHHLEQSGWAAWLPRGWKEPGNDLSAGGLAELRDLGTAEAARTPAAAYPDVARLGAVLTDIRKRSLQTQSGWEALKAWLRAAIKSREDEPADGWLSRMVARAGAGRTAIRLIAYLTWGAVVLMALIIVANELRVSGVLSKSRGRRLRSREEVEPAAGAMSWERIQSAALGEQPRLLLQLVLRRLFSENRLPAPGALTTRELTRAARFAEATDRERLLQLASVAEAVRFSEQPVDAQRLANAVQVGRELLER